MSNDSDNLEASVVEAKTERAEQVAQGMLKIFNRKGIKFQGVEHVPAGQDPGWLVAAECISDIVLPVDIYRKNTTIIALTQVICRLLDERIEYLHAQPVVGDGPNRSERADEVSDLMVLYIRLEGYLREVGAPWNE